MTGPVDEVLSVAGGFDDGARGAVHLLGRHSWTNRLQRTLLRFPDDLVDSLNLCGGRTEGDGERDVGVIAFERTAVIEDHDVASLQSPGAGLVVGERAVRA